MSVPPRSPWFFIPTLYFAEGVPYVVVNTVSVIFYKRMGVENAAIAFWTSLLYLPWVLKMLWGPLVDLRATKRAWILATQIAMAGCLGALAAAVRLPAFFALTLLVMTAAAFVSATHDIAADGFYLLALDEKRQALFVGIRAFFYRVAMIFGSGLMVWLAGRLELRGGMGGDAGASATRGAGATLGAGAVSAGAPAVVDAWSLVFALTGLLFAAIWAYHHFALPRPAGDAPSGRGAGTAAALGDAPPSGTAPPFVRIMAAYFRRPGIAASVAFILLYRLGESMLLKLASPFMLDPRSDGGLALTTAQVGLVYGTVGIVCLVLGGILGGWLLSRFGLRRLIWPFALALNAPQLAYVYMAHVQPGVDLAVVLVAIEQFGYGLGFTALMVYLMEVSRGEYGTSHFAISTGLMALGMMLPGLASGWLQEQLGYRAFFWVVLALGLPGMAVIPWLKLQAGGAEQGAERGARS